MDETGVKRNWMITDMDVTLKNKVVAQAVIDETTVAVLMEKILSTHFSTPSLVTT